MSAVQKTITYQGLTVTNAYHHITEMRGGLNHMTLVVRVYANAAASSDESKMIEPEHRLHTITNDQGGAHTHHTDYFRTIHATEEPYERAASYLIAEHPDYSGGTKV